MWSSMEFFQALVSEHGSERAAFDVLAAAGTPLKAYAKPEDIGSMVAFLASDAAETMTGASLVVDGGYTL
jgi:2-keto-3-deoxy-L-fuconate dehydrogenase